MRKKSVIQSQVTDYVIFRFLKFNIINATSTMKNKNNKFTSKYI